MKLKQLFTLYVCIFSQKKTILTELLSTRAKLTNRLVKVKKSTTISVSSEI